MHEQARHSVGDRKLGDEWQDWGGGVEEQGFDERSGLFVGLAAVGMALGLAGIAALWYLILPRLTQLDPRLPMVVGRIFVGVLGLIVLYFGLIIGSAATGRNLLPPPLKSWTLMRFLVPVALSIGQRLGLSKDRVGSSIIRFNNALTQAASKPMEHRVLILLPRCLRKPILEQILQLGDPGRGSPDSGDRDRQQTPGGALQEYGSGGGGGGGGGSGISGGRSGIRGQGLGVRGRRSGDYLEPPAGFGTCGRLFPFHYREEAAR